jgi:hypothetical protein
MVAIDTKLLIAMAFFIITFLNFGNSELNIKGNHFFGLELVQGTLNVQGN